jgi:hypothetical protein
MGGRGGSGPSKSTTALGPEAQVEQAIRDTLAGKGRGPERWLSIADLEDAMPNMSRQTFERTIMNMSVGPNATLRILPEENQKTLTPRDRKAAIRMGNENNHIVQIRRP